MLSTINALRSTASVCPQPSLGASSPAAHSRRHRPDGVAVALGSARPAGLRELAGVRELARTGAVSVADMGARGFAGFTAKGIPPRGGGG